MLLIHGRRTRVFDQIFAIRPEGGMVFGIRPERWGAGWGNAVLHVYWDGEMQFYNSTGTEKYSFTVLPGRRKKPCIKNPMLLKIQYIENPIFHILRVQCIKNPSIKNLTVVSLGFLWFSMAFAMSCYAFPCFFVRFRP